MTFPSPTLTPPSLSNWQFSYNGLTFGAGTVYGNPKIEGLDFPSVGSADSGLPRDQGELIGLDVLRGRDITFDFFMAPGAVPLNSSSLGALEQAMAAAMPVGLNIELPLWFQMPGWPLLAIMCRPRKRTNPIDAMYAAGARGTPTVQFHATDPRAYGAPSQTATVSLPTPSGGATLPASFPLSFGASSTPGTIAATNSGTFEMRPIFIITGPCTNPSIENDSITGAPALTISNPNQTGYTILAGDQLVINADPSHSVLYYSGGVGSGTPGASRYNWIVPGSQWFNLPPGANQIRFTSTDSAPTAATLQVNWASAYYL